MNTLSLFHNLVVGDYSGLEGVSGGYWGLQGITGGYRGLKGVTRNYRGLKGVIVVSKLIMMDTIGNSKVPEYLTFVSRCGLTSFKL